MQAKLAKASNVKLEKETRATENKIIALARQEEGKIKTVGKHPLRAERKATDLKKNAVVALREEAVAIEEKRRVEINLLGNDKSDPLAQFLNPSSLPFIPSKTTNSPQKKGITTKRVQQYQTTSYATHRNPRGLAHTREESNMEVDEHLSGMIHIDGEEDVLTDKAKLFEPGEGGKVSD